MANVFNVMIVSIFLMVHAKKLIHNAGLITNKMDGVQHASKDMTLIIKVTVLYHQILTQTEFLIVELPMVMDNVYNATIVISYQVEIARKLILSARLMMLKPDGVLVASKDMILIIMETV